MVSEISIDSEKWLIVLFSCYQESGKVVTMACENWVIEFGLLQLLHVYAKVYEGNGTLLLIRLLRYSLDGLVLAQVRLFTSEPHLVYKRYS